MSLSTPRNAKTLSWRTARMSLSWCFAVALATAGPLAIGGCASSGPPRPTMTEEQLQVRSEAHDAQTREEFRTAIGHLLVRAEGKVDSATASAPAVLDILAISGGGDYGAFGAGFLVGWGQAADPAWRRPDFDAVTGVSTGALLAPFAFVGTDESCRAVEAFYRNPKPDWARDRGLLFFLPSHPSFMTIPGLERDIRGAISPQFVEQIAEQSRKGKLLLVSATDLDLSRQKFWEVGEEAAAAKTSEDMDRVQRIFLASSAIPAVFPPIQIDGSLYADGGVTANVFLRLDPKSPDGFITRWRQSHPDKRLPKVRYWVIINNWLTPPPKTVQAKWPSIIAPCLTTATRHATIAELRWLSAQADFVNATMDADIEVRVASIPKDWRPPVEGDFKKQTMESLTDLGRVLGADPNSWKLLAAPSRNGGPATAERPLPDRTPIQ
jgi:hypothetical protein